MKLIASMLFLFFSSQLIAQEPANLKKGFAAEGYDVVAYFSNEAIEGDKAFSTEHKGVKYKFSSAQNLETFKNNPSFYVPQYGGYCAYAIGVKGELIGVNPKTFQLIDDKLYLFYNSWGVNTLEKWNEEGAAALKEKADFHWKNIVIEGN
jgi:YHS domain-containing protein